MNYSRMTSFTALILFTATALPAAERSEAVGDITKHTVEAGDMDYTNEIRGELPQFVFDDEIPPGAALDAPVLAAEVPASAYPNPSLAGVTLAFGSTDFAVTVYDVRGHQIASSVGTSGLATWDGRDDSGRSVPSGVYFARIVADDAAPQTLRIVRR